jgi:NTP pyrophosphatase (non-canonical NTP hydrolase)
MRGTDRERVSIVTSPSLAELTDRLTAFRDARDWRQFHSLKNLILSVSLESAELLELTQWKDEAAVEADAKDPAFHLRLEEESADVLLYLLLIAERAGFDLAAAAAAKIETNETKYPVEKSRGNALKYTEL